MVYSIDKEACGWKKKNCIPEKACMSVEDDSEPSVLRLCSLQPYVPLRRNFKRKRV